MNEGKQQHSKKFLRQRKFFVVLPGLVLPFAIFLLWSLGLVGEVKAGQTKEKKLYGLNLTLPSAAPAKDSNWNKLKYYEQADRDSAKIRSMMKSDPYRQLELTDNDVQLSNIGSLKEPRPAYDPYPAEKSTNRNEERVYKRLAVLNQELENAAAREKQPKRGRDTISKQIALPSTDVDRLERMMNNMHEGKGGEDEEMKQYNELLEKILDIQNPQRVNDRLQQQSTERKREVFAVAPRQEVVVSLFEPARDFRELLSQYKMDSMPAAMKSFMTSNRFYTLDEMSVQIQRQPAIAAVVHEDQQLVTGAVIMLRLLQDVMIAGVLVPKDHFVYGEVSLAGERLSVQINSVQYRGWLLPVSLTVYDRKDGLAGIHVPGAITRDVAKKTASQSAQGLSNINMTDPSMGAQLAGSGLQALQNLVGKTARLVPVTVTAGYPVLLQDEKDNDK